MSRAPTQVDANRAIMRTVSELYLSIFVLFFRITRWKGRMKFLTASFGTAMVVCFMVATLTGWVWIQIAAAHDMAMNKWIFLTVWLTVSFISYFYLDRHGLEFETHFRSFSRNKRMILYFAAAGIVMVTIIAFFMVLTEYQEMFHPPAK